MKRIAFILILVALIPLFSVAQSNERLKRVKLETLESSLFVNQGEFQAEYTMLPNMANQSMSAYYNYVYILRNKKSSMSTIYVNGRPLLPYKYTVRAFRIGSAWNECVSVVKYFEPSSYEIGYGMETVYAYGTQQIICDSVISLTNDGFVYKLNDKYYYSTYKRGATMGETTQIVWLERKRFKEEDRLLLTSKKVQCGLSVGDEYYFCIGKSSMNYYYLYKDDYMPYTVLVVDGKPVELFGNYTYDTFRLKFSYNGKHWMAASDDRIWIDGVMKSVEGFSVSDFMISNNGDYVYKARRKSEEDKGETLVLNGEIIRQQVIIGHFAFDSQQKLRFHFLAAGQWYVYEDGQIYSVAQESNSVLYADDIIDNLAVDKYSSDGMHKLSYVTGQKGVEIDGQIITQSVPYQVFFDKDKKCFRWNAIEINGEGKTDLVIYTYKL